MKMNRAIQITAAACFILLLQTACASRGVYRDRTMDFGMVQTVAVMPFMNLSKDPAASDRVRDVFMTSLLAKSGLYVLPHGEIVRGISRAAVAIPATPSAEEAIRLGGIVKADAVVTGVVREYGEVRSTTTIANIVSVSVEMMETQTGRVVWSASSTKGGITFWDRMFGGGGQPMNDVTEDAVDELLNKLFK